MQILQIQIAVFTNTNIERPDLLWKTLDTKLGNKLDGMPTILDIPSDAVPEMPRVRVGSIDGKLTCNIAQLRVDLVLSFKINQDSSAIKSFDDNKILIDKFYHSLSQEMSIVRMGVIFTLFQKKEKNVESIYKMRLKDDYSVGCAEVSIRTNIQKTIGGMVINTVKTVDAVDLRDESNPDISQKGVLVILDTNNMVRQNETMSSAQMDTVIKEAVRNLKNEIMREA